VPHNQSKPGRRTCAVIFLATGISVCTARQDGSNARAQEPAPAANPMAAFGRLVGGEWEQTARNGTSLYRTWHWGPGKHSIREVTAGAGAGGDAWHELRVMYWHPGRKQVRLLGVNPFSRSVAEGSIRFTGDTADAVFDMHQTGGRRKLGLRWSFDGPDKHHEVLLEETGPDGLKPLAAWDRVRSRAPAPRPDTAGKEPKRSDRLKALDPLAGTTWEARGKLANGDEFHAQTTFELIPIIEVVHARVRVPGKDADSGHALDAYVFHHTGANALRCLALSSTGGVYEGNVSVPDGGSLQLDLTGFEGDRETPLTARLEFESDGSLRQRVWLPSGAGRDLLLDVRHRAVRPKKG
jgi:hypothetical protein